MYWALADHQGTICDWLTSAGAVQKHIRHHSFGRITQQTGTLSNRFGYTGREWDGEIGLYYYRARYYDPLVGRFVGEDPIGFGGGDANLYRYVGNQPINAVDPFGLQNTGTWNPLDALGAAAWVFITGVGWVLKSTVDALNQSGQSSSSEMPEPYQTPRAVPDPNCSKNGKRKTCATEFPHLVPCKNLSKRYFFPSAKDAAKVAFPEGVPLQPAPATAGPCSINSGYEPGTHWNVKHRRTRRQLGSVGQCTCCEENPTPHSITKGAVLSSEPH